MDEEKKKLIMYSILMSIFFLSGMCFYYLYPSFSYHNSMLNKIKPKIKEAKNLNLSYEEVKLKSKDYNGKSVIWCIQNIGKRNVFYNGEIDKRIIVSNYENMPIYYGSKHKNCTNMLLEVMSPDSSSQVKVRFVYALELR